MKDPKELLEKLGGEEKREEGRKVSPAATGYPKPAAFYRLYIEGFNVSIEEPYFWFLHYCNYMFGYSEQIKITDVFAAAENSAFFGVSQQRIGMQQDKVSQFLATIGKMVKELFQLVRELRVLDERMGYYTDSYDPESRSRESAEITLKGIWVDMVEQGAKNPASVYGMSREVQFTTLPDLFFSTHPLKQEDVDEVVERERGQFNRKVKEVLKRKLRTFLAWKESTFEELKNRRIFTLKYLRQHYEIIKMYMHWVKPYLRNIQRLQMEQKFMERADLLAAFETSMIEAEVLFRKKAKEGYYQCVLANFLFRTRPEMSYQQEGYQRGPIHVGEIKINLRAYVWTEEQIKVYLGYREREDFKLLELVSGSVKAAMEALGDELQRYLAEAGESELRKKEKKEVKGPSMNPFAGITKGFSDIFVQKVKRPKKEKKDEFRMRMAKKDASGTLKKEIFIIYDHFKKHHGFLSW